MAHNSQRQMNLAALQRVDASILQIIDNASQVALYKFNQRSSEWEKTEIEGTFFIFLRSNSPLNGFIVMNRLSTTNLIEPITSELEFQLQSPFLLYKNSSGQIYGIWFYDESECMRIEVVLNGLAQSADSKLKTPTQRQRCASEGDYLRRDNSQEGKSKGSMDILSLLCQAQEEYDKQQKNTVEPKRNSPTNKPEIIKPTPLRISNSNGAAVPPTLESTPKLPTQAASPSSNKGTALSLAALFAQANATQQRQISPVMHSATELEGGSINLHRLLSNPANTVEHIEKQQLNETPSAEHLEKDIKEKLKLNFAASTTPLKPSNMPHFGLSPLIGALLPNENELFPNGVVRRHSNSANKVAVQFKRITVEDETEIAGDIITPAMLEQGLSSPILSKSFSNHASSVSVLPLKSPLTFTQPLSNVSQSDNNLKNKANGSDLLLPHQIESDIKMNHLLALTKEHLKESLVHLLENDDEFLSKVHEGYIASLKSQLTRFSFKS